MWLESAGCMLEAVGRSPRIPAQLTTGPFTLAHARLAGLDRWHLHGASWRRLGPSTYVWAGLEQSPKVRLEAARLRLPPIAAFSGRTAAWLHGIDVEPCDPIEATVPKCFGVATRSGVVIRRTSLPESDVVIVRGWRATSITRTLRELCGRLSLTEAVVIIDLALHARIVDLAALTRYIAAHAHGIGLVNLKRAVGLAEPASESPMESRLRMVLMLGGLPRPEAQVSLFDSKGLFLGRPDLYYPHHRLGLEYDGGIHRDRLAEDNRRQNRLLSDGIRLLRFTAADVLQTPNAVVAQVRAMLAGLESRPWRHQAA